MAKFNTEHKMNKYLKPFEFFKELLLKGHEESPYPVFVGLYVSDNHVSLARGDFSYLRARYCGLYPRGNLDDLVERLQSFQKPVGLKLIGIIVSSNNSVAPPVNIHTLIDELCKKGKFEGLKYTYLKDHFKSRGAGLSGITFPLRSRPRFWKPLQPKGGEDEFEAFSAVRMLQVGLDFLNALVDRKNLCVGDEDS